MYYICSDFGEFRLFENDLSLLNIAMKRFFGAKFTSTISIALVLFVIGLMTMGGLVAVRLAKELREQFTITITVSEGVKDGYGAKMAEKLARADYAAEAVFVSPDSALKVLQSELGENPEEFLGYNPLPATVELKLKAQYAESDSIARIVQTIRQTYKRNIAAIDYNSTLVDDVNNNLRRVTMALALLAAALLLISISLIGNTVRLTLHADRFLINTMRLVGATAWFIRRPFIRTHVICGLLASLLALVALAVLIYGGMSQGVSTLLTDGLLQPLPLCVLVGVVVSLGILIPALAAWYACDRYLGRSVDELYLM